MKKKSKFKGAVSTGSTLLNLGCSDSAFRGYQKGGYYFLVGDSASGKTWLSMSCFAESVINEEFKDYRLIFDDVEGGAQMDIEKYFGKAVADKMEPPERDSDGPVFSETVESFYYHLWDAIEAGKPFIYVLDSQDALTSEPEKEKFIKKKKASEADLKEKGSYGMDKPKYHSEHLRQCLSQIRKMGSILIIISQTRDNLGYGFEKKTRSGGKALRFYANLEIWTSVIGSQQKTVNKIKRTIGSICLAQIKKNRITGKIGKDRAVEIPFYYELGIDDVGSCVDYLIKEKKWTKRGKSEKGGSLYDATGIDFIGSRNAIVAHIEANNLETVVRKLTAQTWREVDEQCIPKRKKRYA